MDWYRYIALIAIASQLIFLLYICSNYHFALKKYKKDRPRYRPKTLLIVPCRGLDSDFQKNISSFFNQNYENYSLWFVVADESDPAYRQLCRLSEQFAPASKAHDIQVLVAGLAQTCSQKIHNLLCCCNKIADDIEILAFADSDVCVRSDWLSHIVYPLRKSKNGVTSGYRWFVPRKNNPATLALSAINAKIAQLLGNSRFNQVWGGSMAVRLETFRRLGIDKIWQNALSDDLSLSLAVKKAGMKVAFVPACLAASYEQTTWLQLFEFGRRQFLITRISAPRAWWLGLFGTLYSILGLWGGAAVAVYAAAIGAKGLLLFITVPVVFFIAQLLRAILRQKMIGKLLEKDRPALKAASAADILFSWLWSLVLLVLIISSAFGRTITWRGIRYKLLSPTETIVVGR